MPPKITDDGMVHIPMEDYIPRRKWQMQLFGAFAVPICIALITAGGMMWQNNAQSVDISKNQSKIDQLVEKTATKEEVKDLEARLNKRLDTIESNQSVNTREILESIKREGRN